MPLHLLGKKSWNVYNVEIIARVRRDEAEAKAREEEAERRMQEVDAERRIQILRGERPPTPPPVTTSTISASDRPPPSASGRRDETGRHRKRRRLAGEDDTDRDIRFAREDATQMLGKREELALSRQSDAPLTDKDGHINLFPADTAKQQPSLRVEKNADFEAEAAKKKRQQEGQITMRFSNAAGRNETLSRKPWYSSAAHEVTARDRISEKDVWGNEDPLRKEREKARLDANDPLAAVKKGVQQLKAVERERKRWNEERKKELESLKASARRPLEHRPRRMSDSENSLDGFRLDSFDATRSRSRAKDGVSERRHREQPRDERSNQRDHARRSSKSRSHHHADHGHRHRHRRHHDRHDRESGHKASSQEHRRHE